MTNQNPGTVTVACLQFEPQVGKVEANLAAMERLIRAAAARGAELVVLPELADSGYNFDSPEEARALASPIPEGPPSQKLIALAAELGLYIVSGMNELHEGTVYNSAIICGPSGHLGTFRKLHLWNREKLSFRPGNLGLPVFDTPVGRFGVVICYDGWFPEVFRHLARENCDLVCVPTNWVPMPNQPAGAEIMANILHRAAAHSNGLPIACANRIGTERGQEFLGNSVIIGADGWQLAGPASADGEEILIATIPTGVVARNRAVSERNDVFGDRRTDVYG